MLFGSKRSDLIGSSRMEIILPLKILISGWRSALEVLSCGQGIALKVSKVVEDRIYGS